MGMPSISVQFTEAANTVRERNDNGTVGLIIKDTVPSTNPIVLTDESEIPDTLTDDNQKQIQLALMGYQKSPKKVIVYVLATTASSYSAALGCFEGLDVNYIAAPTAATDSATSEITTWITTQRADYKDVKAVLPNTAADNVGIINFATTSVTDDEGHDYTAEQYCARIAGILAALPITESATYVPLPELASCTKLSRADMDTAIDAGKLIVFWDGEKVKIARGVNSFLTTTATMGAQFKKIHIVELMDDIQHDIRMIAEDSYIGRVINNYDNRCLLLAAIGTYLDTLEKDQVLKVSDIDFDIEAIKTHLTNKGIDVSEMTDTEIKEANTEDKVFIKATLTLYDAIEEITVSIIV